MKWFGVPWQLYIAFSFFWSLAVAKAIAFFIKKAEIEGTERTRDSESDVLLLEFTHLNLARYESDIEEHNFTLTKCLVFFAVSVVVIMIIRFLV